MTRPARRRGYTLIELLCVIAVLVILGAIVLPTLAGMFLDTRVKAGADMAVGHCSDARTYAIEHGRSYQVFTSPDGKRLRVGPDESEHPEQSGSTTPVPPFVRETDLPTAVTLVPINTGDDAGGANTNGWVKLVTFKPDGTCREPAARFELREDGVTPLVVNVRGLTGSVVVNPADSQAGGGSR
jgi:prepilin-type N-terminal cleavage/methylation domain-containing protein